MGWEKKVNVKAVVHREGCGRTLTHHDDPEPVVRPFAQLVEVGGPKVAVPGVDLVALAEAVAVAIGGGSTVIVEHLIEVLLIDALLI